MEHIQKYFDDKQLGIQVLAPVRGMGDLDIIRDLERQLAMAHFGLAEISATNPNVLFEAGMLKGMGKPVILLRSTNSDRPVPFDIFRTYRAEYDISERGAKRAFVWLEEELDKAMEAVFHMLPEFERVPKWNE